MGVYPVIFEDNDVGLMEHIKMLRGMIVYQQSMPYRDENKISDLRNNLSNYIIHARAHGLPVEEFSGYDEWGLSVD